jgi:predicted peptidase
MVRTFSALGWRWLLVCGLVLVGNLSAVVVLKAENWQDRFEAGKFEDGKHSMPYRLLKPDTIEPGKSYPLVLFLHGIGERGVNNTRQLVHGVGAFATEEARKKYPCFLVAPQCPLEDCWVPLPSLVLSQPLRDKPTPSLAMALSLFEKLATDLPADKDRLYITGLSMGAFGTWDIIERRPDFFAAALVICGGGDPAQAPKLTKLPLWAFHGDADFTVPCRRTTAMIDAIVKAGGAPKITIYPKAGHMCWSRVYGDPAVMEWFFSQRKPVEKIADVR